MLNYKYLLLFLLPAVALISCKEEQLEPLVNDGVAPGPVSNVSVENLAGGARLTYNLPKDEDLLYVEAVYSIRPNLLRNTKSSFYNNNLTVDGFSLEKEYDVTLYAVDKGENRSAPVTVKIKPGMSPVKKVYASLALSETFGGIRVQYGNPDSANIVITVMVKNAEGKFVDVNKKYTNLKTESYAIRGLPSVDTTFYVFISDRYDNLTDTLSLRLKPVFEEQVPNGQVSIVAQAGDVYIERSPWKWVYVFDGNLDHSGNKFMVTNTGTGIPQSFTMDLKKTYKMSRFKMWQRRDNSFYTQGVRNFELWGANSVNITDPSYNGWTKIASYEHPRPSGFPDGVNILGDLPDVDLQYILAGTDYDFPLDTPPLRYLRWKTTRNWGASDALILGELMFWGQAQ